MFGLFRKSENQFFRSWTNQESLLQMNKFKENILFCARVLHENKVKWNTNNKIVFLPCHWSSVSQSTWSWICTHHPWRPKTVAWNRRVRIPRFSGIDPLSDPSSGPEIGSLQSQVRTGGLPWPLVPVGAWDRADGGSWSYWRRLGNIIVHCTHWHDQQFCFFLF